MPKPDGDKVAAMRKLRDARREEQQKAAIAAKKAKPAKP